MWDALLDQTASIQRATVTQDASGASVRTEPWPTILAGVPVSIQPMSANAIYDYARMDINVSHLIYTTMDLNSKIAGGLLPEDRFSDMDGTKYVVVGVRKQLNQVLSITPLYEISCLQRIV